MSRSVSAIVLLAACMISAAVAIALASGEDGGEQGFHGGETPPTSGQLSGDVLQSKKTECPPELTGEPGVSQCGLVFLASDAETCNGSDPGSALAVRGISCELGSALRISFAGVFTEFDRPQDVIYRPALASGRWPDLDPSELTGWTCRAIFESGRSNYMCWRDRDWLTFEQS